MDKKGFNTGVGREANKKKDKKEETKLLRVSPEAHQKLRIQSIKEDKTIKELIDEVLNIN